MDKLLWVTAPLAVALVALGWAAWRGRLPSRTVLNVAFSVLLLAYVLGTAGLGIFWVANQQLPVFDWHYLFGYVTVALLVVHLCFNFRVVWHVLRRALTGGARQLPVDSQGPATGVGDPGPVPRAARASGEGPNPPTVGRRAAMRLLGLLGGFAAAAGAGYLLGLRHGRTEIVLPTATGPAAATAPGVAAGSAAGSFQAAQQAWALVEQLHGWTSHTRTGVLRRAASPQWALAPAPFKRYPQASRLSLGPPPSTPVAGAAAGSPLGIWLWHTAGVSARSGGIDFRTSPSSGALFATELYVQVVDLPGVPAGLWHYDAQGHALERLQAADARVPAAASVTPSTTQQATLPASLHASLHAAADLPPGCVAVVLASAIFARSGHKYGDRTYRYVTADLGHALENLRVVAQANGMEAKPVARFDDDAVTAHLGLDGQAEAVLAVLAIRPRAAQSQDTTAVATQGGASAPPSTRASGFGPSAAGWVPAPWEQPGSVMGADTAPRTAIDLTQAFHRATSLQRRTDTSDVRSAPPAAAVRVMVPARADAPALSVLSLIASRRSVRRFATTAVTESDLAALLQAMTDPPPQLSTAVRIDVLTMSAQDRPPSAWRLDPGTRQLQQRVEHGDGLRPLARAAALDQDVIGNAALVFVLSLDRATLLADPLGPARAWRHGFIEAGMVGERLYLAGAALGLGVCGVGAFYDDEASALVGVDPTREWVVHFAAVGVSA